MCVCLCVCVFVCVCVCVCVCVFAVVSVSFPFNVRLSQISFVKRGLKPHFRFYSQLIFVVSEKLA